MKDVPIETRGRECTASTDLENDDKQETAMTSNDTANNFESISISTDGSINTRGSDGSSVEFVGVHVSFNFCAF